MLTVCTYLTPIHSSIYSNSSFCSHYSTETPPIISIHFSVHPYKDNQQHLTQLTIPSFRKYSLLAWFSSYIISDGSSCDLRLYFLQDSALSTRLSICPFLPRQSQQFSEFINHTQHANHFTNSISCSQQPHKVEIIFLILQKAHRK